jgi:hypothetical protein
MMAVMAVMVRAGGGVAVGGDGPVDKVLTLGTILRKYNPDIKGLSTGKGDINSAGAHLNLAVTGAIIQGRWPTRTHHRTHTPPHTHTVTILSWLFGHTGRHSVTGE